MTGFIEGITVCEVDLVLSYQQKKIERNIYWTSKTCFNLKNFESPCWVNDLIIWKKKGESEKDVSGDSRRLLFFVYILDYDYMYYMCDKNVLLRLDTRSDWSSLRDQQNLRILIL